MDLAVDLSTGDYPTVTHVIVTGESEGYCAFPPAMRTARGVVQVDAAAIAEPLTDDALDRLVLLKRDIMDALVLDLKNLRDVRANDLWLRADAGALVLAAADLLGQLDQADATTLLGAIPPPRAEAIETLLRFPADTAGGIMTSDVVVAPADATVGEVVDYIRPQLSRPDFIYFVYLLTDLESRRLRGIVTLRDLSLADPATPVDRLMQKDVITIGPLEPALEAAHRVSEYGLNALPVVTPDGSLVGIVTLDKAMAQIVPQVWRDHGLRIFA